MRAIFLSSLAVCVATPTVATLILSLRIFGRICGSTCCGPQQVDPQILPKMRNDKIKVATVGVATHTANEDKKMALIARATGGNAYSVKKPTDLPAIYIKESRLVSQSFLYEKPFAPQLVFRAGPTDKLPEPLPQLGGFVRTTPKASPLVELPILTPRFADMDFPLLAYWHYGLGKAVAFT